jgi:hypothetical protein
METATTPSDDILLYLKVERISLLGLSSIAEVERPVDCTFTNSSRLEEYKARWGATPVCSLPLACEGNHSAIGNNTYTKIADEAVYCDNEVLLFGLEPGQSKSFPDREYVSVFETDERMSVFRNEPTRDGGRCNATLGHDICMDCYEQVEALEILAYMGIYSQLLGVLFAISRLKDSNNSILIHVLATGATTIAFSAMVVSLFAFYHKCFQRFDESTQEEYPDVRSYLGTSFALSACAAVCNCLQISSHLYAKHDRTLPYTAGTPFRFFCFAETSWWCPMIERRSVADFC